MKLLNNVLLISALTVAPLAAINAQPMDMSEQQMSTMQTHMKEMNTLLQNLKQEADPDKREALLQSHAKSMQTMMAMMEEKSGAKGHGKKKGGMMKKGRKDSDTRIEMMEKRMTMMEKMMGQMMGHTVEKSKFKHKHKK
ncbi:MAG: hypothetical protein CL693_20210 [Cellvibrionaceae bacterium]|nr:hypothetical protein [Cellvibrionaceae bacterium]|tara:strand:- start:358 stop:774 length:417 start_codon:yes stop_codon:yes gene_type:complete